jgi:hypothetical protein
MLSYVAFGSVRTYSSSEYLESALKTHTFSICGNLVVQVLNSSF